jgi:hypothetical protein
MKTNRHYLVILFISVAILFAQGCKGEGGATAVESAPANSNEAKGPTSTPNQNPQAAPPVAGATGLQGTYTLSEVRYPEGNRVISEANATEITFRPDGTFARVSKKDGVVDHEDSGIYYVERYDRLVLKIMESKKRTQYPPVEKRHRYELTPDGERLTLLGTDGKLGVFRRTRGA